MCLRSVKNASYFIVITQTGTFDGQVNTNKEKQNRKTTHNVVASLAVLTITHIAS